MRSIWTSRAACRVILASTCGQQRAPSWVTPQCARRGSSYATSWRRCCSTAYRFQLTVLLPVIPVLTERNAPSARVSAFTGISRLYCAVSKPQQGTHCRLMSSAQAQMAATAEPETIHPSPASCPQRMHQGPALLSDAQGCLTQVAGPLDDAAVAGWLLQPCMEAAATLRVLQALHAPSARVRMPPLQRAAVADACRAALLAAALAAPLRALLQAAGMLQARARQLIDVVA